MKFNEKTGECLLALLRKREVEVRSLVVRQDGDVVFSHATAPFPLDHVHPLYSVTKSFTSCAVGMLVEQGAVDINAPWVSYLPEYGAKALDSRFCEVSVRDLLTMQLGQDAEPQLQGDDDWALGVAGKPLANDLGTAFFYNSLCSHLLSILVERVSGQTLDRFLEKRLFEPLGISRWWWEHDRQGHATGGFGLHLSTPDLAKFGQCLLDGGTWEGRRVVPSDWVREATRKQVETRPFYPDSSTEDRNGYGYQYWMCAGGGFRCSGLWGQLCYVLPEQRLVVASSSATSGSKPVMDALYDVLRIETNYRAACPKEELPAAPDKAQRSALDVLPMPQGAAVPTVTRGAAVATSPQGAAALTSSAKTATSASILQLFLGQHAVRESHEGFTSFSLSFDEPSHGSNCFAKKGATGCQVVEEDAAGCQGVEGDAASSQDAERGAVEGSCLKLAIVRDGKTYEVRAGYGAWAPLADACPGVGELFPFATASAEVIEPPTWDTKTTFGAYAWKNPSTLEIVSRELDETRRCVVTVRLDGNHIVLEIGVQNMMCGLVPTRYALVSDLRR
ncbi:MAG: beta-lactamase family protein [Olsenella sp.]|jgi:CubicO group peptidase (beta-lactamase class C family)|nr:beta-lactamase family protein [Olsenella sp.]